MRPPARWSASSSCCFSDHGGQRSSSATSIPLAILSAIIGLHVLGESLNVMTLGGLALAVGILVDDATVMIENIDTHVAMGKPLETAIIDAANQIVVPTFVATLCIAIVWFPLFQLSGVSGWLFMPMAKAIIFAMLASFILSRTLVPTMAKYILEDHNAPHGHEQGGAAKAAKPPGFFVRFQQGFERRFDQFREGYNTRARAGGRSTEGLSSELPLAIALGSLVLYYFNGREFFPETKSGTMQMHMRAPIGTRIEASGRIASLVSLDIQKMLPGQVEDIVSNCGLPVGPHNLAFIPTPTIGSQDCDLTIDLKSEKSPVWEYRAHPPQGLERALSGNRIHLPARRSDRKDSQFRRALADRCADQRHGDERQLRVRAQTGGQVSHYQRRQRCGDPANDAHADPLRGRQSYVWTRRRTCQKRTSRTICS